MTIFAIGLFVLLLFALYGIILGVRVVLAMINERDAAISERDKAIKAQEKLEKKIEKLEREMAKQVDPNKFYVINKQQPLDVDTLLTTVHETYYQKGATGSASNMSEFATFFGDNYAQYTHLANGRIASWASHQMPAALDKLATDIQKIYAEAYNQ